jgi:hypothetical protein
MASNRRRASSPTTNAISSRALFEVFIWLTSVYRTKPLG